MDLFQALTAREKEVVALLIVGQKNQEIARFMGISPHTVKRHISNIFEKTGASSRLELTVWIIERKEIYGKEESLLVG